MENTLRIYLWVWEWDRKICAVWHHETCWVMTNDDPEGWMFLSHPNTNNGFFFLLILKFRFFFFFEKWLNITWWCQINIKVMSLDFCLCKNTWVRSGPTVIKTFSCSTQLSTKFILLINVKMPTIVGILTFYSMINATYDRLKLETTLFVGILVFIRSWNFMLSWVEHEKSFITSGPDCIS